MPPSIAFDFVTTCIPPTSKTKDDTMELTTLVNLYPGLLLPAKAYVYTYLLDFLTSAPAHTIKIFIDVLFCLFIICIYEIKKASRYYLKTCNKLFNMLYSIYKLNIYSLCFFCTGITLEMFTIIRVLLLLLRYSSTFQAPNN